MIKETLKKVIPDYVIKGYREAQTSREKSRLLKQGAKKAEEITQQNQEILLEIGAGGKKGINGWTTLDLGLNCDIYWDLLLPLPFPDNSITKIYSSHVLEHFYYPDLIKLLTDCYRVLKPAGAFSVCVPDASVYVKAYLSKEEFKPEDVYKAAYRNDTKIDLINYVAYMDGSHRHLFDQEGLLAILKKIGFKEVSPRKFDPEIDMQFRDWESIYAEGIK